MVVAEIMNYGSISMLAIEVKRGVSGIILVAVAALFLVAIASCTTKSANLQQPPEPQPEVQAEQSVELLSPLELLKSSSEAPGRFNTGDVSSSVQSYRVSENIFFPRNFEPTDSLKDHAYAAYHMSTEGCDGDYDLMVDWGQYRGYYYGDYDDIWVGLPDWELNAWSWSLTDEGLVESEIVEQHISSEGDLLVVIVVGGDTNRFLHWLRVGPDMSPTAKITALEYVGVSTMSVTLSAEGSADSEWLLQYAWDETGDGVFTDFGPASTHSFTLTGTQTVQPVVRVRDYAHNTTDAVLEPPIVIFDAPTMLLTKDSQPGDAYLDKGLGTLEAPYFLFEWIEDRFIHLTAHESADGSGDPINPEDLHWALLGDPSEGILSWTAPGELLIGESRTSIIGAVAYDDEYNRTNVVYFLRGSPPGYEVVLCFTMNRNTGNYPLQVDFDNTMSYATNESGLWATPSNVEWDFEGDGENDHLTLFGYGDHGSHQASYVFHAPGSFTVTARPLWYGEEPLFEESFIREVSVTDGGGPKWHFNRIPMPDNLETTRLARQRSMDLIEIQGKPVIRASTDGEYEGEENQNFILSALDNLGTSWEASATILPVGDSSVSNLSVIGGYPAFLVQENDLAYVQALDATGTTWDSPVTISAGGTYFFYPELADVNGLPAVTFEVGENPGYAVIYAGYDGITAPNGWFNVTLDSYQEYTYGNGLAIHPVGGRPAVVYQYANATTGEDEVRFVRALDGIGQTWGTPVMVDSSSVYDFGNQPSLTVVNGLPAVSYIAWVPQQSLVFSLAADSNGNQWNPVMAVGNVYDDYGSIDAWMYEFKNKPLMFTDEAVYMGGADTIRMWTSEDGEGSYWTGASPVFSSEFRVVDTAIIDGKPAIVMLRYQWDDEIETSVQELRFGILY